MRSKETRNIQLACLGMIAAHFQGEWTETGIPLTLVNTTHIHVVLLCQLSRRISSYGKSFNLRWKNWLIRLGTISNATIW